MAAPPHDTAAPDAHHGHLSYLHTGADLPPVAVIDHSPIGTRHKITFGVIAVLGAVAWAIIALVRGETVNAVWFVVAALCTYVIAYRFYGRLVETKIVQPRDDHATPAEVLENSGATPKLLEKESQMRLIGYGGMLTESFVAIMALITASMLDQHLYLALNAPAAHTGGTVNTAAHYVNSLGLPGAPITDDQIRGAAASVGRRQPNSQPSQSSTRIPRRFYWCQ
jgi:Carbon starvation protein CstA